jgi:cohesin complex subunit SCC1
VSLDSALLDQRDKDLDALSTRSRDASEAGFGANNFDMDLVPDVMGMELDHGLSFGDEPLMDKAQSPEKAKSSRACMSSSHM